MTCLFVLDDIELINNEDRRLPIECCKVSDDCESFVHRRDLRYLAALDLLRDIATQKRQSALELFLVHRSLYEMARRNAREGDIAQELVWSGGLFAFDCRRVAVRRSVYEGGSATKRGLADAA